MLKVRRHIGDYNRQQVHRNKEDRPHVAKEVIEIVFDDHSKKIEGKHIPQQMRKIGMHKTTTYKAIVLAFGGHSMRIEEEFF